MPVWPSDLPKPLANGFSFENVDPVIRTEMASGPKRARRQFTQTTDECSMQWLFESDQQLSTFESFHKNELSDGAAWFDGPFKNGQGASTVSMRFAGSFKADYISGKWRVTAKMEIKNRPVF